MRGGYPPALAALRMRGSTKLDVKHNVTHQSVAKEKEIFTTPSTASKETI